MKKFLILGLSTICVLLSACSKNVANVNQIVAYRQDLVSTVDELQEEADLIVVVEPTLQENMLYFYSDGNVSFGYTKTTGTIKELISGDVLIGDSICITEECYTTDSGDTLWTQGGYLPMNIGESYLLFLKAYQVGSFYEGMYFPIDLEYGKYVLPSGTATFSNNVTTQIFDNLQIGEDTDIDDYTKWYEEIFTRYPELIK